MAEELPALAAAKPELDALVATIASRGDGAKIGLVVVDVPSGQRLAWHSDVAFDAASVIKVPILVAALREVERGTVGLDAFVPVPADAAVAGSGVLRELRSVERMSLRDLLTLMIVVSDNTATNLVVDAIGGTESVNAMLREQRLRGSRLGRKLMDLEARARGEHNVITADDVAALFTALVRGKLLDAAGTSVALDILERQQVRDRLPRYLPAGVRVAHKTGELDGVRHDAGVLHFGRNGDRPVVVTVLTERFTDVPDAEAGRANPAANACAEAGRIVYAAYT